MVKTYNYVTSPGSERYNARRLEFILSKLAGICLSCCGVTLVNELTRSGSKFIHFVARSSTSLSLVCTLFRAYVYGKRLGEASVFICHCNYKSMSTYSRLTTEEVVLI